MKISDYMSNLAKTSDFVENFGDYANAGSDYISDIIAEIADDNISIYTDSQVEFAMENDDAVDEAFANGIAPDASTHFKNGGDFRSYCAAVGVAAWYEANTREIYNSLNECVLYAVCEYLYNEKDFDELTQDQIDVLDDLDFNDCNRLWDAFDKAETELGYLDEDEDEDED